MDPRTLRDAPIQDAVPDSVVRERILDVAAKLFAEHGYEAVSLRQICETARVSKGAIYHYFSSKEELLGAIVISSLEHLLDHLARDAGAGPGAADRLRRFIISQAEFFEAHAARFRVAMADFAELSEPIARRRVSELRNRYTRFIRRLVAQGIAAGEFHDADVNAVVRMVLAILYWLARWHEPGGRLRAVDIAASHADIMLRGVRAR
jgi:AcrR family transcriptional regulator